MLLTVQPVPVEIARPDDRPAILALLRRAELPIDDLGSGSATRFWVLGDERGHVTGAVGLERFGDAGLLRSLVVDPEGRGTGQGRRLVEALERVARSEGLRSLTLLTETAEAFFAHLGYQPISRASAPAALQASTEFAALCPASATTMHKTL